MSTAASPALTAGGAVAELAAVSLVVLLIGINSPTATSLNDVQIYTASQSSGGSKQSASRRASREWLSRSTRRSRDILRLDDGRGLLIGYAGPRPLTSKPASR
jgi:hypothetical protein